MIDENEYKEAIGALIERVIKTFSEFNEIIKKNHCSLTKGAKFEYLHFLLFILADNFQKWNLEDKYLDIFMQELIPHLILEKIVSDGEELRDILVKSKERWSYYSNFIGKTDYDKKLYKLMAREAMYLEKLISDKDEASNISFEILMHLQGEILSLLLQQSLLMDLLYRGKK